MKTLSPSTNVSFAAAVTRMLLLLTICLLTVIAQAKTGKPTRHHNATDRLMTDTVPAVKIVANYCIVAGKVRLTATATPAAATFSWSTGETGNIIDVDIANMYYVTATFKDGDTTNASIRVAEELVVNGDFSAGNTGFYTEYDYTDDVAGNTELYPEGMYGIGTNAHDFHNMFYGREHSTTGQTGNFMIVNGSTRPIGSPERQRIIWQETVKVHKNTNYYFSAQAMNVNPGSPARLQFQVNGVLVGTVADLDYAAKPGSDGEVNVNNWVRFYSNPTWNSDTDTTAVIQIINLNTDASGNDFGLDDISFSTLSPFITLMSPAGTDAQTSCINTAIEPIVYAVGSDSSGHTVTGLPAGVQAVFTPNFLTITGTPGSTGKFTYSITTVGTCRPVTVTGVINIPTSANTWTGALSNDWSDANNWLCGIVPVATTDVLIRTNTARMPQLTTASVCKKIELEANTELDLNGQSFTNYGGVTGIGLLKGSVLSALTIDAAGTTSSVHFDQSVPGTANALNTLTIKGANNLVTLENQVAVYGVLAPQNGILAINDTLILRSTAAATASVDVVTGAITYGAIGKVTAERYFPSRRAWRLVTAPLTNTGTIYDNWQNGGRYETGKGTYVTGTGATSPACGNGLDWSPMNNPSLKVNLPFVSVLNTHTNLSRNRAVNADNIPFFLFVRGDRDPANTNMLWSNNTTLSSTGNLQTGTQTFTAASVSGGFTFIGNPYASPVDFNKLTLNNLKHHFLVWDPYLNIEQGGYILAEETMPGHYEMIPRSPGGLSQLLQSGQAFFVETESNGAASLSFTENAKSATAANPTAFRPTGIASTLRIDLYHLNDNNNTLLLDGVMAMFDSSYSKNVDGRDVPKSSNPKEMIALVRDNKTLALERRPVPGADDTLFLRLTKTTQRNYRLAFEPIGIDPLLTAFLEDSYTKTKTALTITGNSTYDFVINAEAASADVNRFRIVFKRIAGPLPVTFRSIHAKQQGTAIAVGWTVENELNIKHYEVERSSNGSDFSKVNTTTAIGGNRTTTDYSWLDESPLGGNNYYRVKSVGSDGQVAYSKTVVVNMGNLQSNIAVTPNPATGNEVVVALKNSAAGVYEARLFNALGQTLQIISINHTGGSSLTAIHPNSKLAPGIYQLAVTSPDQTTTAIKVIVQ